MLTADNYGNSAAYFANNFNSATANMLGLAAGFGGKSRVSVYSVVTMGGAAISVQSRIASPSAAVIGWVGLQPVAFPLVSGWNYDTPLT